MLSVHNNTRACACYIIYNSFTISLTRNLTQHCLSLCIYRPLLETVQWPRDWLATGWQQPAAREQLALPDGFWEGASSLCEIDC